MQISLQKVVQDFNNLSNPNSQIRDQANKDLLEFQVRKPTQNFNNRTHPLLGELPRNFYP
mgnify:CR=1 FL=1